MKHHGNPPLQHPSAGMEFTTGKLLAFSFLLLLLLLETAAETANNLPLQKKISSKAKQTARTKKNSNKSGLVQQQVLRAAFLKGQNQARVLVGVTPLVWSARLESYAKWWAKQRRADCALRHSTGPYGENIFWGSGRNWQPADAVAAWVAEKKHYDHSSNTCLGSHQCGHYTQIVWRSTTAVGCARVVCYNGQIFMTCNYNPPGNYVGQKPY